MRCPQRSGWVAPLRAHPKDRERYAATKRRLARDTAHRPRDYSLAKNDVIDEIYGRIFAA
ncbi:GrpB family protein [Micromonospora sp. NPDC049275]|uniref:GrpB family protein n=1 Tax=Micromonospora sp. NPDC049275 TaxID=3364268 RepID=UPI00371D766F